MANVYIISAASGTGKTSLVKALLESLSDITVSVSHTTRAPRPAEAEGVHYYFVDQARFEALLAQGELIEHARVFDHYYGTSRDAVLRSLRQGSDVILEIDWQGARQARQAFADAVSIFILPPSRAALDQRLRGRRQDNEQVIARRLNEAREEMSHWKEFDYLVVNDDFDTALRDLQCIVRSRRLARDAAGERLQPLLGDLLTE